MLLSVELLMLFILHVCIYDGLSTCDEHNIIVDVSTYELWSLKYYDYLNVRM